MCGGRGTRLDLPDEKPLVEIGGEPMVDRVLDALAESRVETVHAVVSLHTPETHEHLAGEVPTVETPGEGYVADLQHALETVKTPVLTVVADLPLLTAGGIDDVLAAHDAGSLTVCVPADYKRRLGVSVGTTFDRAGRELAPTGINVVADSGDETMYVTDAVEFAANVNHARDARIAEVLV